MAMPIRYKRETTTRIKNAAQKRKEAVEKRADDLLKKKTDADWRPSHQRGTGNNYYNPNMPQQPQQKKEEKKADIWKGLEKKTSVDDLLGGKTKKQTTVGTEEQKQENTEKDWRPSHQQGTGSNYYNPNMPTRTPEEILNGPDKKKEQTQRTFSKAENERGYPHSYDVQVRPFKDYVGDVKIGGQERPQTMAEMYENADPKLRGQVAKQATGMKLYRDWLNKNPFVAWANLAEDRANWQNVQKDTQMTLDENYEALGEALNEDDWEPGDPFYDNMINEIRAGGMPDVISNPVRNEKNDRALMDFYYGDGFYDEWEGDPEREEKLQELWAPIEDGTLAEYRDRVTGFKQMQTDTEYAQSMNRTAEKQLENIERLEGQKAEYNELINQYDDNITMPDYNPEYDKGYTDENIVRADVQSNDPSVNNDIDRISSFIGGGNELKAYAKAFGDEGGNFKVRNNYKYAMMMTDGTGGSVDEIGIFMNLYNQAKAEGREPTEAMAFLDGLQTTLRARYSDAEQIDNAELARKYPVVASVMSLASHQMQTYLDLPRHIAHFFGDKSTEDYNSWWYRGSRFSDQVEGTIAKDLGGTTGKIYSGVMNSASNLLRALAAPKGSKLAQTIGGLGGFFLQVDQEATARYLKDHDYNEAATLGAIDAMFEVFEEFLPFETMLGSVGKGLVPALLQNGLSELGQEFTGATLGEKLKGILTGEDPNETRADEIIAQKGYEKDGEWVDLRWMPKDVLMDTAKTRAAQEFWNQAVEQGIGGLFGGLLGGTYGSIATATGMVKTGKNIRNEQNTVEGVTGGEQLVEAAAGMDGTESQQIAQDIQAKEKEGKRVTNYEIGKLAAKVAEEANEQIAKITRETVENRIFEQLKQKDVTGEQGRAIAEAMTNGLIEGKLTAKESKTIAGSMAAMGLWRSYNSVMSEDFTGLRQDVAKATEGVRSVAQKLGELTGHTARNMSQVSAEVDEALKGNDTVEGALDSLAKSAKVISARFAEEAKKRAKDNEGVKSYVDDATRIYLAAMSQNVMPKVSMKTEDAEGLFNAAQEEFAENDRDRILKQEKVTPGEGTATYDGVEYGTKEWEEKVNKGSGLHSRIKMQMNVLGYVAQKMGFRLNFVNRGGQEAYVHGWESADGSITVNIAGMQMSGLSKNMLATIWHELTHWLEQNSNEGYAKLRSFILGKLRSQGVSIENRLLEIMDNQNSVLREVARKQAEARGEEITEEKLQEIFDGQALDVNGAMAELVAQSCEELLNTEAVRNELAKSEPTVFGQVKAFVRRFIAQLNAALKGIDSSLSREAKALTKWKEEMAQLWLGAREEALGRTAEEGAEATGERFSTAAATELDQKYMDAVKSGDMETAQRIVDQAAKNAGYTMKVFHGTPTGGFTVFRDWSYFTENRNYANRYNHASASSIRGSYETTNPMTYELFMNPGKVFDTRQAKAKRLYNEARMEYGLGELNNTESGLPDWTDGRDIIEFIEDRELDYDTIILDEGADGGYGDEVVSRGVSYVTRGNMVKSAETVTRDDNGEIIPPSERFNTKNPDIRYSTAEMDREYMDAVKSGDMDRAEQYVAKAAEQAGYTDKAYHGSETFGFTEFDMDKSQGVVFVAYNQDLAGTYTNVNEVRSIEKATAKDYDSMFDDELAEYALDIIPENEKGYYLGDVELNVGLTYDKDSVGSVFNLLWERWDEEEGRDVSYVQIVPREALIKMIEEVRDKEGIYELYTRTGNQLVLNLNKDNWNRIPWSAVVEATNGEAENWKEKLPYKTIKTRQLADMAKANGYDSVRINNISDHGGRNLFLDGEGDIGIFFNPSDVKSADTVVYDNDGNVIPLSERFNRGKTDIRWSTAQLEDEKQYESAYREAYERMTDLKLKLSELDADLKDINKRIEAAKPEEHDALVQEIIAWDEKTGYGQLKKDYDQAQKDYEKAQKEWNKYLEERDEAEEQRKIQESGLTEAEWRRKEAVKQYGYTGDFREAGYLLPNGRLLNFCGSKGQHYGMRGNDHRDIGQIYANKQGSEAMVAFMADGNIRVMAESPGIDISTEKEPTSAQYTAIKNMAYKYAEDEYFNLDFTDKNGNNVGNIEYEGKINPSRIVNDIKYFFQTGNVREQSTVSMFHGNRWSVATPDMDVSVFMQGLNENSLSTEQERTMLRQYKELKGALDVAQFAVREQQEKIRKLEAKDKASAWDREQIRKANNILKNYIGKQERLEAEMAKVTGAKGFAKLMYEQEQVMRNLASGKTYEQVRAVVEQLTKRVEQMTKEMDARQKQIDEMRGDLAFKKRSALVNNSSAEKIAGMIRKDYGSDISLKELTQAIVKIRLKMATKQNIQEDVEELAWKIALNTKGEKSAVLEIAAGRTIVLGKQMMEELKGQHRTLKDVRKDLAGTGIKVRTGETGTLDGDWSEWCDLLADLDRDANPGDKLDELLRVIRNAKEAQANSGAERMRGHVAEAAEDLKAMIAAVEMNTPKDPGAMKIIGQMNTLIDEMAGGVGRSTEKLEELKKELASLVDQGKMALEMTDEMQRDIDASIKYNNALTEQSEAAMWKKEKIKLIDQLKSENTERLIEEQQKWKARIEKDKTVRKMMNDNMMLRKAIHTNITRMKSLLMNETDLKHMPEYMKGLAREVLGMIVENDLGGRKITGIDRKDLMEMQRILGVMKGTDGEFDLDDLKLIHDEEAQSIILDALADIEDGIKFYNASAGGGIIVTLQGFHNALDRIAEAVASIKSIIDAERTISDGDRKILVADAAEEIAEDMNRSRFRGETRGRGSRQINMAKRAVVYGNMTPVYFFKNLRNRGMEKRWKAMAGGENRSGLEFQKAGDFLAKIAEEAGYKDWAGQKVKVTLGGRQMEITVDQIMSLYAVWRREHTENPEMSDHLKQGGVFFQEDDGTTGKLRKEKTTQKPVKIDDADVMALYDKLTEKQKAYLDKMVGYLSNEMSELGNEASMRMYGIRKYKEKWYFPMQVWDGVKSARSDKGISGTTENRAANKSWSKRRKNRASNALIIGDFTQVAVNHIVEMINYNTLAPEIENLNKVLNYQRTELNDDGDPYAGAVKRNMRVMFQEAYGKQALEYLETFMKDLNGGAVQDQRKTLREAALTMFKKNAVAGSLSVALQQPLSYIRAAMMISPKYLAAAINPAYWKGSLAEMSKYSGVAVIKQMGRFDMNFGQSAKDYVAPEKKESVYAKVSDKLTILPEKMDQMTWTRMWTAAKLETRAKNPGMDMKSDAFLQKVAERFNEVMRATQVYDSVLVKSSNMRSQNYAMKVITSFMSEPTLSINVLADATRSALAGEAGGKALLGKAVATFLLSAAAQAFFKGLMGSGRTPDEKKTWEENFLYKWWVAFMSEANPLGLIPGYSDLIEVAKNGELNDDAMGAIGKIYSTWQTAQKAVQGKGKGWYRDLEDTAAQLAQLFTNVPAKNLMRDARAMYNWISQEPYAKRESSAAVKAEQATAAIFSADNLLGTINTWLGDAGFKTSNKAYYQRLYSAQQRGDTRQAEQIAEYLKLAKGQDEKAIRSGVGSYGRADLWTAMDANKAEDIGKAISLMTQAGYEPKDIKTNITNHYKAEYLAADSNGKRKIRDAMQKAYRKLGYTAADADKTIANWEKKKKDK